MITSNELGGYMIFAYLLGLAIGLYFGHKFNPAQRKLDAIRRYKDSL